MDAIPPSSWDTHVHVFDPIRHPYIPNSRYRPPPRRTEDLVAAVPVTNFVVVMSGPEGTNTAHTLEAIESLEKATSASRKARGVVVLDIDQMTPDELRRLDRAGIRSVRFNTHRDTVLSVDELFTQTAARLDAAGLAHRWTIDAVLFDVATWHGLIPTLRGLHRRYGTVFVGDHLLAAQPASLHSAQFDALLALVDEGVLVVKISGLTKYGRDLRRMKPVVAAVLQQRQGRGAMFGSDWPHVIPDVGATGLMDVDLAEHLALLKEVCDAVGPGMWEKLMRDNAAKLYK